PYHWRETADPSRPTKTLSQENISCAEHECKVGKEFLWHIPCPRSVHRDSQRGTTLGVRKPRLLPPCVQTLTISRTLAASSGTCSRTSKVVMNGKNSFGNSIFDADINSI